MVVNDNNKERGLFACVAACVFEIMSEWCTWLFVAVGAKNGKCTANTRFHDRKFPSTKRNFVNVVPASPRFFFLFWSRREDETHNDSVIFFCCLFLRI